MREPGDVFGGCQRGGHAVRRWLLLLCMASALLVAACGDSGDAVPNTGATGVNATTPTGPVANGSTGAMVGDVGSGAFTRVAPPGFENTTWTDIEKSAHGTTVRMFMYGGFAHVNRWMDAWVAPRLQERHGIRLERVPMDAAVFVNRLLAEKQAGRDTGTMDLLWINGENFRNAREAGLLWGPFSGALPSSALVEAGHRDMDFGYPVEGYESPWGSAQLVLEYDTARTPEPPRSVEELAAWIKAHPGRFTYPQPPDFTGSAFVRQLLYAVTGGHEQYMGAFDKALFDTKTPQLWAFLNDLKPYLWQEGRAYPRDAAMQDSLFARGEVDFSISYHPVHAQANIGEGTYPPTVRTLVLREGSIRNTHFVAIPFNAPNRAGAMVVADFLLSPEAQTAKLDPANWGDFPVLDVRRLTEDQRARLAAVDLGKATLSPEILAGAALPEIPASWLEALEKGWQENVAGR